LNVTSDDTIVLPGDFSWAMNFDEAKADLII
jgi:predicted phosphohydrolase